jgi:hypothetical protein
MPGHGEKLSRMRESAISALLTERTIVKAAERVGVAEKTLRNWLRNPAFRRAYMDARRACVDEAVAEAQALALSAVRKIGQNMKCGNPHVEQRAAEFLAEWAKKGLNDDVEERLAALEGLAQERKAP